MKVKEIVNRIFHVQKPTMQSLASMFLRFQEHFEGPEFRGKVFSRAEYRRWYTENSEQGKKTGKFTYFEDWAGFNIPSHILRPFYEGQFDPLIKAEQELLDAFEEMQGRRFYIIGTIKGDDRAIKHEVAHGLFYTQPKYREAATNALRGFRAADRKKINKYLLRIGYCDDVLVDETHAFTLADTSLLRDIGVNKRRLTRVQSHLGSIFSQHCEL